MTSSISRSASRMVKALSLVVILVAAPSALLAQRSSPSPFVDKSTQQDRLPSALNQTLEKVSLEQFDIRFLRNPSFFRFTGFNPKIRQQVEESIAEAVSTAKSKVGNPPTQPRVMTTQGTQFHSEMLNSHYDDVKSETDRQIRKVATPRFLQSGLSKSELARLRQVWLQVTGPNSDVLSDLNVSAAQLLTIENQLNEVRATARKAGNDEAVYRASASGIKDALKTSLTSSQWSTWTQLIGKEVETN